MANVQVLHMAFLDGAGKQHTLRIPDPRTDITAVEVQAAMQKVIDTGLFGNKMTSLKGAKIIDTDTQDLNITIE